MAAIPPGNTPISDLQELCTKKVNRPQHDMEANEGAVHEPTGKERSDVGYTAVSYCALTEEVEFLRPGVGPATPAAQPLPVPVDVTVVPPSLMDSKSAFHDKPKMKNRDELKEVKQTTIAQHSESSLNDLALPYAEIRKTGEKLPKIKEWQPVDTQRQPVDTQGSQNLCVSGYPIKYMTGTLSSGEKELVNFQKEVAIATRKHSPSHTLDRDDDECHNKEEVEKKAFAMSIMPFAPGITTMDQEEIRKQPDVCEALKHSNDLPTSYNENEHWMKGQLLGTGAFGKCYLARDIKTGKLMTVKQISFSRYLETEKQRVTEAFTKEVQIMAKLNHPNIVRILRETQQEHHLNLFLEWMPGGSVADLLRQYGKFSNEVITSYTLQTLTGLSYIHENHMIHRDLKGDNLLIDSTGQRLRIGDFGTAVRLASNSTGDKEFKGQYKGTTAFMAPEVIRGENYGRASDVWSVGCCLIQMATTDPPWNAKTSNLCALIYKICSAQSPPSIPENLSPLLRDLLLRCLKMVKEQRPSARELLNDPLFTQFFTEKM